MSKRIGQGAGGANNRIGTPCQRQRRLMIYIHIQREREREREKERERERKRERERYRQSSKIFFFVSFNLTSREVLSYLTT